MAATGELVELLAKALRRARMSANDVGATSRVRGALDPSISNPSPKETLSDWWNDGTYRAPDWAHPDDWALARTKSADGGFERPANPLPIHGGQIETPLTDYERAMMRQEMGGSTELARSRWGVDDPVARMALLGAGLGGGGLSLREVLRDQWSA
jgi:hypothetical protein